MKKVIIIGGASGIGKQLAVLFYKMGYEIGIADVNKEKLQHISKEFNHTITCFAMDVSSHESARATLMQMINQMQGVDIFVFTAGLTDKTRLWKNENKLYQVNAIGFAALCSYIYDYWSSNKAIGKIIAITSVVANRGLRQATAYSASKAFMKTYIQALRQDAASKGLDISITEIRPGYVRTPMTENESRLFWSITVERAAECIYRAAMRNKKTSYLTFRWKLIGILLKIIPDFIFNLKSLFVTNYTPALNSYQIDNIKNKKLINMI